MNDEIINFVDAHTGTVYFCAIGLFLLLEAWAPLRAAKGPQLSRWIGNIGLALINTALLRWAAVISGVAMAYLAQESGWGLLNLIDSPPLVGIVVSVLIVDLVLYGCHRLYHASDLAWRFHVVHHSDAVVDLTTAFRFHPFETLCNGAATTAAAFLLGLSPEGLLLYQLCMSAQGFFGHSNVRTPEWLDRLIGLVLVTPRFHHIHHAAGVVECHSNFGVSFTFWDRLFGSGLSRDTAWLETARMGVEGCVAQQKLQLLWLLGQPFRTTSSNASNDAADAPAAKGSAGPRKDTAEIA